MPGCTEVPSTQSHGAPEGTSAGHVDSGSPPNTHAQAGTHMLTRRCDCHRSCGHRAPWWPAAVPTAWPTHPPAVQGLLGAGGQGALSCSAPRSGQPQAREALPGPEGGGGGSGGGSPLRLAWAITSAALLLITLVTYRGQLACLATVMARYTASASTWGRGLSGRGRALGLPDGHGHKVLTIAPGPGLGRAAAGRGPGSG